MEVERTLVLAGIFVDCPPERKRELLYELYHKPSEDLPTSIVRTTRAARGHNQKCLRDLIIENPALAYNDFMQSYGRQMPTVTRASYNSTRNQLRKAGYDIPRLPPGPTHPAVKKGKVGR